ncbi:MAG: pteridine reductase [Gammaproteobacteria bacterium]|nr:pteridine reductase [Gammaproteobacteria bacterium]
MNHQRPELQGKVALITGAARRVGATVARALHHQGMNLVLTYRRSTAEAHALQQELHQARADSVLLIQSDLLHTAKLASTIRTAQQAWGRLDVLINNASSFYPTPIGSVTEEQWDDLMGSNLKAPFFLSQAAAKALKETRGCIINITDIHAERPLKTYNVYSTAKAGLAMLTKALARDLGPEIRVNSIAPGAILWPEHDLDELTKHRIIARTALKRQGSPEDIARTILFLICDAPYISGEIIKVDGGRTLND